MDRKKKILCILLSLILTISNFPAIITGVNNQGVAYAAQYTVGDAVFTYYEIEGTDNVGISWYVGTDTEIVIPETINGKKVTEITNLAFNDINDITKITIPKYVSNIENFSLSGCDLLEEIVVSEANEYYKSEDGVLYDKTGEMLILYPPGKTTEKYVMPDTVTNIGYCAFYECNNIKEVEFSDNIVKTFYPIFHECLVLENVILSENMTNIPNGAFYDCDSIKEIVIPSLVTDIEVQAFHNCNGLEKVVLPKSLTSIGYSASFSGCTNLKEFVISEEAKNYKTVDGVLYNKEGDRLVLYPMGKGDEQYIVPNGVTSIDGWSFQGCDNLKRIIFPETLTSIGQETFFGLVNLTEYFVPKSVKSIDYLSIGYKWLTFLEEYEKIDGITIYGYDNSYAQTYATENEINFISLSSEDNIVVNTEINGDLVNGSEIEVSITMSDVENLGGAEIEISYDSNMLDYISGEVKEKFKTISNEETSGVATDIVDDGEKIKISMMYSEGIAGNGTVATLKFNILADAGQKVDLGLSSVLVNINEYTEISSTDVGTSFIVIEEPEFVYGDVNSDGRINVLDVVLIKKHIAGYENLNIITDACDVNVDDRINVLDAVLVMKYIAGYDVSLGK